MNKKYLVYYYISASRENPVSDFLDSLSEKQQAKILRIFQYIKLYGLQPIFPHIKKVAGSLFWEIRILGKDNIRIIYVVPLHSTILFLHGFIKKSQKTPVTDLKIAVNRYKDWLRRNKY